MSKYILDTDTCIELFKHNHKVLEKINEVGQENCFITEITIAELFYGAAKSNNPKQFQDIGFILQSFELLPIFPSLRVYGTIKALLENQGNRIDEFDLLIGACAVYNNCVTVTSNIKHFSHIPNLQIEDWAEKSKH
jgi:tRNA(fMet)-specific endonuclease VapC